ncbi:MAG TPA: hypothetical protein EYP42_00890, partial [Aquificales bacterium]|nr:hypothetical protein [Aquificales bacterium]
MELLPTTEPGRVGYSPTMGAYSLTVTVIPSTETDTGFISILPPNRTTPDLPSITILAYQSRTKAKAAVGHREVFGWTRNRAIVPYSKNHDQDPKQLDKTKTINPHLTILRLDRVNEDGSTSPMGAIHNFSIHGTVVPFANNLYTSDSHGIAERYVCAWVKEKYGIQDFVYGLSQGTAGDISPNWEKQDFDEGIRIGKGIAQHAFDLFCELD